jgi:uncharacterized protein YdeI (YjbR/CyaY-like superfamily)
MEKKFQFKNAEKVLIPEILKNALHNDEHLDLNFQALSSCQEREYGNYLSEAKQNA